MATDAEDSETVIGFLLCLPVKDDPKPVALRFMAVKAGLRRQGVARGMMHSVLARYPHAELACAVERVPCSKPWAFKYAPHVAPRC